MKALPKIVQWQLQKATTVSAVPHPDADQLTAFTEQRLPLVERTAVLEHLSQCSDCRQVASFAEVPTAFPTIKLRSAHPWRPILAWSGVAACVLAVIFLLPSRENQRAELVEVVPPRPVAAKDSSRSASVRSDSAMTANAMDKEAAKESGVNTGQRVTDVNGSGSNRIGSIGPSSKKATETIQSPAPSSEVARDSQPQAMQAQAVQKIAAEKAKKDEPAHTYSSWVAGGTVSAGKQSIPAAGSGENTATDMRESFAPSVPRTSVATSNVDDRYPRWTLNSDGTLLRSLDIGASWQKISIPGNAALLHSIATVGAEVWVGGARGALYHSADSGVHWTQVNPATGGKLLADDVISIEFATAQQGKLVTSKQEVWTTTDGGQTWSKK